MSFCSDIIDSYLECVKNAEKHEVKHCLHLIYEYNKCINPPKIEKNSPKSKRI